MNEVITLEQYTNACLRLEELIPITKDVSPEEDPLVAELVQVSATIEQYEEVHFPIGLPKLIDVIKLRMFELNLNQKKLATLLEYPASRVSEFLNGKKELTLKFARALHQKLNIDSDIILQ
jgi:HTH-type transcriptional regulator/antitoxin HigA